METAAIADRPSFLLRNPWLFVVMAFALLITAWSALITVAMKHAPQTVEAPARP